MTMSYSIWCLLFTAVMKMTITTTSHLNSNSGLIFARICKREKKNGAMYAGFIFEKKSIRRCNDEMGFEFVFVMCL